MSTGTNESRWAELSRVRRQLSACLATNRPAGREGGEGRRGRSEQVRAEREARGGEEKRGRREEEREKSTYCIRLQFKVAAAQLPFVLEVLLSKARNHSLLEHSKTKFPFLSLTHTYLTHNML